MSANNTIDFGYSKNQTKKQNNKITKKQNSDDATLALAMALQMKVRLVALRLKIKRNVTPVIQQQKNTSYFVKGDLVIYREHEATVLRSYKPPKGSPFEHEIRQYDIEKSDGKKAINIPHSSLTKAIVVDELPKPNLSQFAIKLDNKGEREFVEFMQQQIIDKVKHNKLTVEKAAKQYGIASENDVKELTELAIVLVAKRIVFGGVGNLKDKYDRMVDLRDKYEQIVDLYLSQVNLSQRTSWSIIFQQYSTPCPISFLAGLWVMKKSKEARYFEPSAGNGLLCHALPYSQLYVNELEDRRILNLKAQPFAQITTQDAALPFKGYDLFFDGVVTNPPFGKLDIHADIDGYVIKKLEHVMAINAIKCMKDDGRAAIIVGGHTEYDDASGVITNKGSRYFLNYLYHFYNVIDIIPIDGHKLYSRQGTAIDTSLILIDGRKYNPDGIAAYAKKGDVKTAHLREVVSSFDDLFERIIKNDPHHFSTMQDAIVENQKSFVIKPGEKVSFLDMNYTTTDGVVDVESHKGFWIVRVGKGKSMTVKESDMVPQIISCGLEKNGQGYKAFKNIKSEFDIKHYRVAFADKTDRIVAADDKADARYKAISWKLNNL